MYYVWTITNYALNRLSVIAWTQCELHPYRSDPNSNNWFRYGVITSQARKYIKSKCNRPPGTTSAEHGNKALQSLRKKAPSTFWFQGRLHPMFAKDFLCQQLRISYCHPLKVFNYWNLTRMEAEYATEIVVDWSSSLFRVQFLAIYGALATIPDELCNFLTQIGVLGPQIDPVVRGFCVVGNLRSLPVSMWYEARHVEISRVSRIMFKTVPHRKW